MLPSKMFYATPISVTLWICVNHKKQKTVRRNDKETVIRAREEILFIDARELGDGGNNEDGYVLLTDDDKTKISSTYFAWQSPEWQQCYNNVPEFCYSATKEEVRAKNYSLAPSKYIEFVDHDFEVDYAPEVAQAQIRFTNLLKETKEAQDELVKAFGGIGYAID